MTNFILFLIGVMLFDLPPRRLNQSLLLMVLLYGIHLLAALLPLSGLWLIIGAVARFIIEASGTRGVYFSPFSRERFHLFGGQYQSFILILLLIIIGFILMKPTFFNEVVIDWWQLYQDGVIDLKEYRDHIFSF